MRRGLRSIWVLQMILIAATIAGIASTPASAALCNASANATWGYVGIVVSFGTDVDGCSGNKAEYNWTLYPPSGGRLDRATRTWSYQLNEPGEWTWELYSHDSLCFACSASGHIIVEANPCKLSCTATVPTTGKAGVAVPFNATAKFQGCVGSVSYGWGFGDNSFSSGANTDQTYTEGGLYTWTMNATGTVDSIVYPCSQSGTISVTGTEQPSVSKGGRLDNPYTEFEGGDGTGQCGDGMPNYWINTSNLNLYIEDSVFSYQGLGPKIRMAHSYNADPSQSGMFGNSWSFAYESSISAACNDATVNKGSGATVKYTDTLCSGDVAATPPVEATPPEGKHDRLTWHGNYWLMVEKATFWTYRYDKDSETSKYLLSSITDANGNAVQITYNTDKTIKK